MAERSGIFAGEDPFALTRDWMDEAAKSEVNDPHAMALATVDASGLPNVRIVLLKEIEKNGFLFYTNYESQKAQELDQAQKASFVLHWKSLGRQIRARGLIEREDGDKADAYYASRPMGSRIGAWASKQSRPLADRETLMAEVSKYEEKFGDQPPRPPHWGGFRLTPLELEFWANGEFRLHDRYRWTRKTPTDGWHIQRLNP